MFNFLTKGIAKVFGTKSEKDVKVLSPYIATTNDEFRKLGGLSNDEFRQKTIDLKNYIQEKLSHIDSEIEQLKASSDNNQDMSIDEREAIFKQIDELDLKRNVELEEILLEILPKAFAIVKETARRFKENELWLHQTIN